ncbi:hypothetical protein GGP41_004418 [Bipolaris sorokiniana]|uniref:Uncharacterized protein n=1 Tax=Cochliobolus sativus TaxID=45130 RepID=A0A8H5ZLN7_COCSA|nr:hypothetical protein GGP41_004418 [Bipolaris sorokiniana]
MLLAGWFDEGPLSMMCIRGVSFPTLMALYRNCQRDQPPPRLLFLCTHAAQQQSSQQPQPQSQSPQHVNRRCAVDRERSSVERQHAHGRVRARGPRQSHQRQSHGQSPRRQKAQVNVNRQPTPRQPLATPSPKPHQVAALLHHASPALATRARAHNLPCTSARLHACTRM